MRQEACITNIEDLKQWFDMNQRQGAANPYFTIHRGPESKGDRIIFRNEEESDPERAWSMMEDMLEMHTGQGGMFRVFICDKPKHNVGITTLYKIPSAYPQGPAGIGGMYPGMYGMYGNPREMVEQEVARERKLWEMERKIDDMAAAQDAKVGELDNMLQEFMPILKDLGHKFGMKIMGYGPAPMAAHIPAAPPIAGNNATDQGAEGYDYDRLEPALDELRTVIPDVESNIEKLARWARENPDMARQLLQNL